MCGGEAPYRAPDSSRIEHILSSEVYENEDAVSLTPEEEALLYRKVLYFEANQLKPQAEELLRTSIA